MRFLLVFFLARYLAPEDVGMYGLLVATIGFTIYVLGLDLYTFTSREILKSPRVAWRGMVSSHFSLLAPVGVLGLSASLLFFAGGALPWSLLLWFLALTPTEHVGYEVDRMLIAMSDQLNASLLVLLRQGILPTAVIPLFLIAPGVRSLETVLALWAVLNVIAVAVGLGLLIYKTRGGDRGWRAGLDWRWVVNGLKVALPFLIGTLSVKALFTLDRQAVAVFGSLADVGVYTFAMSVAAGLTNVLAVSVHQFSYPRLVTVAHDRDMAEFRTQSRRLWIQSLVLVVLAIVGVLLAEPILLDWVGEPVYARHAWLIPVSMAVIGVYNLSLVPHYVLYAVHADIAIVRITIGALLAFLVGIATTLLSGGSGLLAAVVGVGAGSMVLLAGKAVAASRLAPRYFR